jgi:hypothetical protein
MYCIINKITSNAIAYLTVRWNIKRTSFSSSKSNLVEVLENGTTVGIDSGITLQLTMTDNGKFSLTYWNYIAEETGGVWLLLVE